MTVTQNTAHMNEEQFIYLPQTMEDWPWKRAINPFYKEVKAQSDGWLYTFNPFNERSQLAFDKCDFALLASLSYPHASKEHLRTGCDLMQLFFVLDEYSDVEETPNVVEMVNIIKDALHNPDKPRPEKEILLGELARQFWSRAILTATPTAQKHFIEAFDDYLDSVVTQAEERDKNVVLDIERYLQIRRQNIGARPSYVPAELGLDIPDEAFYHPVMIELTYHIAELIILDNDIASYNKEQASGDDMYNILTVVMRELNLDLKGALEWTAAYHKVVETSFMEGMERLPTFSPEVDRQLREYVHALAMWPRSNDCWNFESGRYFGNRGLDIQKTRRVPLMPKKMKDPTMKTKDVEVTLVELSI